MRVGEGKTRVVGRWERWGRGGEARCQIGLNAPQIMDSEFSRATTSGAAQVAAASWLDAAVPTETCEAQQ